MLIMAGECVCVSSPSFITHALKSAVDIIRKSRLVFDSLAMCVHASVGLLTTGGRG